MVKGDIFAFYRYLALRTTLMAETAEQPMVQVFRVVVVVVVGVFAGVFFDVQGGGKIPVEVDLAFVLQMFRIYKLIGTKKYAVRRVDCC